MIQETAPDLRVDSPATQRAAQIRVRFIGAEGNFNSVATHGHRINTGINGLGDPHVTSEIVELPRDAFDTRLPHWLRRNTAWLPLVEDIDVLVVVKSSVFDRFESGAAGLRALCKERGIILVSSPADGPGANAGDTRDRFSEEIADYVLTASREQYEYLCEHRDSATVFHLGVATRPPRDESIPVRERVRTVVWENPTHYDPNFNATRVGMSKAEYAGFETQIRAFCEERGAELLAFGYWRDNQSDSDWQEMLLNADIAIECKALGHRYTNYQLQKPPTKLQNYLALGLPVVCDSVPSYREIGKEGKVLFADSMEEWRDCLDKLFKSQGLRAEMSAAARQAVERYSIAAMSRQHVVCFERMLERTR